MRMSSPTTSSRALLRKIQSFNKNRVFRVAIIGQNGVGKSALTVRFLTRRFIGDYDPTLEKMYTCTKCVMGNSVEFEILDTAGQYENSKLKQHIKWCDAVILVYSVTDRCSFNEARRLNFTITASSRRRRKPGSDPCQEYSLVMGIPVSLVANQSDRIHDRMVSTQEGQQMAYELGCIAFAEISVREEIEAVMDVFEDLFASYRKAHKVKSHGGHPAWSMVSLERLALGHHSGRERLDSGGGGGGGGGSLEEEEEGYEHGPPPSPGFSTRRREALVS